jgi:choloylglycine hydrolase
MKRYIYQILFFLILSGKLLACTDFIVQAQDGSIINGRSLEFGLEFQSKIKFFSRNQRITSQAPGQKKGIQWISKYGFLGVTGLGLNFPLDGVNEMGLSFGYLWMPGATQYPTVPAEQMKNALDFIDLGSWLLGNFSTVDEVKAALESVYVWAHTVPPLGVPPVHAAIHDAQGRSLVVEFVGGQMKVYENPIGVLTNSPPFDWQMTNLQNYLNLNPENPSPITFKGVSIAPPGQGTGFLGLPGDWSPPSRFVKMATFLRFAKQVASGIGAVNLAEHLLNSVDIALGLVRDPGKDTGDYTQWIVIKDLTQKILYFRSYHDLTLKMIDLKKLDFTKDVKNIISVDMKAGAVDVSNMLNLSK